MYRDYLGDSVYASYDGYQIWLSLDTVDNELIALEPAVLKRLWEYVERVEAQEKFRIEKKLKEAK
jgi:hypothetical protein